MVTPLVTCCITTFNSERFIAEAIESVLQQSYASTEVLIVDDRSTDRTLEIAASYGGRVETVANTGKEMSPPVARNEGVRRARGELIAFLDADDLWYPQKLERQMAALADAPGADYCLTLASVFWEGELAAEAERFRDHQRAQAIPGYGASCLLARRRAFDVAGGFDPAMFFSDALEWFQRADRLGLDRVMVSEVLVGRRFHRDNLTRRRSGEGRDRLVDFVRAEMDRRRSR